MNIGIRALFAMVLVCACFAALEKVHAGPGLNPLDPGLPLANAYERTGIPGDNVSAMCVDCHSSVPGSGRTSHFVANGARRTNLPETKEKITAWTGSGAASKYGNFTNWVSDNTVAGEMICESCHNLVRNVAGGNNLLEFSLPGDLRTATLCEGCHTASSLSGHHAMSGDTLTDGSILSTADSVFTRGYVDNITDMGPAGMAVPPGSEVRYPAADRLPCLACHGNGHGGFSGTGARILRRGYAGPSTPTPPGVGSAVSGADLTGIDRQFDIDASGAVPLIGNYTALCDACHKSDD